VSTTVATNDAGQDAAPLSTHQKALAINLDATSFGSFAEIGAGQEVARWFLTVGAASGTVAKTISAYDKEVSDDLYGAGTRYVSKERLLAMLDREWKLLITQLEAERGSTTRFFAFADTVSARNFAGTNDCHGWMGVRFQDRPKSQPSDLLLHVNMRDDANVLQAECLGLLGVNLLHAILNQRAADSALIAALFDNIAAGRIEIDFIEVRGDAFGQWNASAMHVNLVRDGRAEAVAFTADGAPVPPNELLHKKPVVASPITVNDREAVPHSAMMQCAERVRREVGEDGPEVLPLYVVLAGGFPFGGDAAHAASTTELVKLADDLRGRGRGKGSAVLMCRSRELYRATGFIRRYTQAPLRFATTLSLLVHLFDEARYEGLDGRLLEGLSRLFAQNVQAFALAAPREDLKTFLAAQTHLKWSIAGTGPCVAADELKPPAPLSYLYEYLLATGFLVPMDATASA
jgi:hypothetical protein